MKRVYWYEVSVDGRWVRSDSRYFATYVAAVEAAKVNGVYPCRYKSKDVEEPVK